MPSGVGSLALGGGTSGSSELSSKVFSHLIGQCPVVQVKFGGVVTPSLFLDNYTLLICLPLLMLIGQ